MSYFGNTQGMVGDPGFFGTLFNVGKRIGRAALGLPTGTRGAFQPPVSRRIDATSVTRVPGIGGLAQRAFPGGRTGFEVVGGMPRRRRRMNPANPKALRKAIRRQNAFVNLAKGALKNSGFKVVSTSAGKVSRATMDKAVAAAHHRRS